MRSELAGETHGSVMTRADGCQQAALCQENVEVASLFLLLPIVHAMEMGSVLRHHIRSYPQ